MHGLNYGRPPPSGKRHRRAAPSSLGSTGALADTGIVPSRMGRAAGTLKEPVVINFFEEIATAIGSISSFDDVATGVASVAFCIAGASMFAVVFASAM